MNSGDHSPEGPHGSQVQPSSVDPLQGTSFELPDYGERVDDSPAVSWYSHVGNRKILIGIVVLGLILAAMPSAYRMVKNARSEKLLAKSGSAFSVGDSQLGITLLKQALALSPGNDAVQHAVEIYNARSGDEASRAKLLARMRGGSSGSEELMSLADLEARSGHVDTTRETLGHLPKNISSQQSMRVVLIEAALIAHEGNAAQAADLCLQDRGNSMEVVERDRLRIQGAIYLLAQNGITERSRAVGILMQVVNARNAASLSAWRIMARIALSPVPEASGAVTTAQLSELVKIIPDLSGSLSQDRLLAAEIEIKSDPSSMSTVINRLKEDYRLAPRADMLEFARWLNKKQLPKETLAFVGQDRPRQDTDWLLVVLDAESSLGNWKKISEMMEFSSGGGVPVAVKHLYLARVAMMTGDDDVAAEEWRKVSGALYLEKPETLAYIAGYEEQIGAFDRAARTYRELANRDQTKIPGLVGLIRCQPRNASVETMIPLYEELLVAAPDNGDARTDLCYLNLLLKRDDLQSAATAEKLFAIQPNSLARISVAALGRLRSGNIKGAVALYEGKVIDWTTAAEPWRAVRSAVLRASGDKDGADLQSSTIDQMGLRPEERSLLK